MLNRAMDLEALCGQLSRVSALGGSHADHALGVIACEEALAAARKGNYGVGAVLVGPGGEIVERGHNLAFEPRFRSDFHAEMVVMNAFEDRFPGLNSMQGYTLVSSLEPCPMCLARLLISGVETVKFVAHDELGGMVTRMQHLPVAWKRLSERQIFLLADVSDELRQLAQDLFVLNLEALRSRLWSR